MKSVGVRFLFRLLKREAITRKFALRAREIRLAAASQAGGRSAANLRTGLAVASVRHGWLLQNKSTPVGGRFLFRLLKREASTRKFALRAREIRLAAASQAGGRSATNLRTGLAFASVRHGWLLQNKSTPIGVLLFWLLWS